VLKFHRGVKERSFFERFQLDIPVKSGGVRNRFIGCPLRPIRPSVSPQYAAKIERKGHLFSPDCNVFRV
jgi:hypothetical protein